MSQFDNESSRGGGSKLTSDSMSANVDKRAAEDDKNDDGLSSSDLGGKRAAVAMAADDKADNSLLNSDLDSSGDKRPKIVSRLYEGLVSDSNTYLLSHVTSFLDFKGDLMKLCALNKAFNKATIRNEPIWQNVLRHICGPALQIFVPCGAVKDTSYLYKIVSRIASRIYNGHGRCIREAAKDELSYSEFINFCSSLRGILRCSKSFRLPQDAQVEDLVPLPSAHDQHRNEAGPSSCIFCGDGAKRSVGGSLLVPLAHHKESMDRDFFPTFHSSHHSFSLACDNCHSFRIEAHVKSKALACECISHDNGGEVVVNADDFISCQNCLCNKALCPQCQTVCDVEDCNSTICTDCSTICDECERNLCWDHHANRFCERCDKTLCEGCARVTWLDESIRHESRNIYSICSICTPDHPNY